MNELLKNYPGEDRSMVEREVRLITDTPEDLEAMTDTIVAARVLYQMTNFHRNPDVKEASRKLMSAIHSFSGDYLKSRPLEIAGIVHGPDSTVLFTEPSQ